MNDNVSKLVSKLCHDMASIITALDFGVDLLPKDILSTELRSSVDKGSLVVVFFRGFFVNPSKESVLKFIDLLNKKIIINIKSDLDAFNYRFLLGAFYICSQTETKAIDIESNKVSIHNGKINRESIIAEYLINDLNASIFEKIIVAV